MAAPQFTHIQTLNDLDVQREWLPAMWQTHQQLRPQTMTDFAAYEPLVRTLISENQQFLLAHQGAAPLVGLAMFNMHHNTYQTKILFLEDLVVDESQRGTNIGTVMLAECERIARAHGCQHLSLDSGVHRGRAHKFYFTHGYTADCFHFSKPL